VHDNQLYGPKMRVAWGPSPSLLLIASWKSDRNLVTAVDLEKGRTEEIYSSTFKAHGLNRWTFDATHDGRRIVISEDTGKEHVASRIIGVEWQAADATTNIAHVKLPKAGLLLGKEASGKISFPIAASFAPSGLYLQITHYLKSLDRRGTAINGVGVLESFDISQIECKTAEQFQACDALHFSDGPIALRRCYSLNRCSGSPTKTLSP
jgi:hypothetical protein